MITPDLLIVNNANPLTYVHGDKGRKKNRVLGREALSILNEGMSVLIVSYKDRNIFIACLGIGYLMLNSPYSTLDIREGACVLDRSLSVSALSWWRSGSGAVCPSLPRVYVAHVVM